MTQKLFLDALTFEMAVMQVSSDFSFSFLLSLLSECPFFRLKDYGHHIDKD